jgi:hypothetical protein
MKNSKLTSEFIDQMVKDIKDLKSWTFVKQQDGVSIHQKMTNFHQSLQATRAQKTFKNCKLEKLDKLLHEEMVERHGEWNNTYSGGKYYEKFDKNHNIQYWEYKLGGLVAPRDFLVERKRLELEDGSILLIDASTQEKNDEVKKPDNVRCELPFNLRLLKQVGDDVEYEYMNLTDLKGYFPYFLVNLANPKVCIEETVHIEQAAQK